MTEEETASVNRRSRETAQRLSASPTPCSPISAWPASWKGSPPTGPGGICTPSAVTCCCRDGDERAAILTVNERCPSGTDLCRPIVGRLALCKIRPSLAPPGSVPGVLPGFRGGGHGRRRFSLLLFFCFSSLRCRCRKEAFLLRPSGNSPGLFLDLHPGVTGRRQ